MLIKYQGGCVCVRENITKVYFDNEFIQRIIHHTKMNKTILGFKKLIIHFNNCEIHILILILVMSKMMKWKQMGDSKQAYLTKWIQEHEFIHPFHAQVFIKWNF